MLVAEFLASDEAEDLSDRESASRCADHIVNYGCDQDFGRPLRMSPAKAETFLLDWLPRKVHALPGRAARDAARARRLGALDRRPPGPGHRGDRRHAGRGVRLMGTFTRVYRDPASFGLEQRLVARLLPDSDLEALPRRVFAFGVLQGSYRGTDLATLDPASPRDRRILLEADHDEAVGHGPERRRTSDRHLALADRLWRGDPPELWEAAQRLLDIGEDRHAVLHALMDTIRAAGSDEKRASPPRCTSFRRRSPGAGPG